MRRGPALLQANRQPACPYPIIVPKQLQIAMYPMIGPKASNPDQVVRLPQFPRQQPGSVRIVFEVFLLRVPMQRSTELGGDGTQMAGGGCSVAHHFVNGAFRPDAHLLDEVLRVLGGGVRTLKGLPFRAILQPAFVGWRGSVGRSRLHFRKDLIAYAVHVQRRLRAVKCEAVRTVVEPAHAVILHPRRTPADAVAVYPRGRILHDEARILIGGQMQVEDVAGILRAQAAAHGRDRVRAGGAHDLVDAVDAVIAVIRNVAAGIIGKDPVIGEKAHPVEGRLRRWPEVEIPIEAGRRIGVRNLLLNVGRDIPAVPHAHEGHVANLAAPYNARRLGECAAPTCAGCPERESVSCGGQLPPWRALREWSARKASPRKRACRLRGLAPWGWSASDPEWTP